MTDSALQGSCACQFFLILIGMLKGCTDALGCWGIGMQVTVCSSAWLICFSLCLCWFFSTVRLQLSVPTWPLLLGLLSCVPALSLWQVFRPFLSLMTFTEFKVDYFLYNCSSLRNYVGCPTLHTPKDWPTPRYFAWTDDSVSEPLLFLAFLLGFFP